MISRCYHSVMFLFWLVSPTAPGLIRIMLVPRPGTLFV
jgi:hypothetical protein